MINQIQYKKFTDQGWQFTDNRDSSLSFNYKSPRLNQFIHFLAEHYESDIEKELVEHEKMAYLSQTMWPIAKQLQHLQDDIRRQLKIHVERNLPLPEKLKVDITLKIV